MRIIALTLLMVFVSCSSSIKRSAIIEGHHKGNEIKVTTIKQVSSDSLLGVIEIDGVYNTEGSLGKFPSALTTVKVIISEKNGVVLLSITELISIDLEHCAPNCSYLYSF